MEQNSSILSVIGSKYTFAIHWELPSELKVVVPYIASMFGLKSEKELTAEGEVVYSKDGVSILRVINSYAELDVYFLNYKEVKKRFSDFEDVAGTECSDYLCLNIETEQSLYYVDPETGEIQLL